MQTTNNMTPSQQHYANVGYLILHHGPQVGINVIELMTKLGHANLATIPQEGPSLPFGGNGNTGTGFTPMATQVAQGPFTALEGLIGEISSRGVRKQWQIAKPFKDGKVQYPTLDAFGRQFPSIQELMAMGKAKAARYFTNSGWPKVMVGATAFYMQENSGESYTGKPINAFEWRGWNGRVGREAVYFRVEEAMAFWKSVGVTDAKVAENLKEAGLTPQQLSGASPTQPTQGAQGRKSRTRATASR